MPDPVAQPVLPAALSAVSRRRELGLMLGLAAVIGLLLSVVAGSTTLWDRDEPRFSRATVEMVQSGDYIVPTFNHKLRADKPPGVYWAMSVPIRLLGPSAFAARLPSVLAMALACLFTGLIARRMLGLTSALWAMVVLGTAILPMLMGTFATADALLLLGIVVSFDGLHRLLTGRLRTAVAAEVAVGLTIAQLAKGPVGLAVVLLAVFACTWASRRETSGVKWPRRSGWALTLATLAGTAAFLAWGIAAHIQTHGEFTRIGLGHHVLERSLQPLEHHGGRGLLGYLISLPIYIPIAIAGFFPWTLHLPAGVTMLRGRSPLSKRDQTFLLAWVLPTLAMMSLVATKLPHYILPAFPALAIAIAAALKASHDGTLTENQQRWLRGGIWFLGPIAVGVAGLAIAGAVLLKDAQLRVLVPMLVVIWTVAGVMVVRRQLRHEAPRAGVILLGAWVIGLAGWTLVGAPAVERTLKPSPALAAAVREAEGDRIEPVAMIGYAEPTLVFYLNRPFDRPVTDLPSSAALAAWAAEPGPGLVVATQSALRAAEKKAGHPLGLHPLTSRKVLNYSDGDEVKILILRRGG